MCLNLKIILIKKLSRSTKSEDKSGIDINYLNANELNQRELTLIGIVDAKTLQNSAQFDGSVNIFKKKF
jgi:hypothetical protein